MELIDENIIESDQKINKRIQQIEDPDALILLNDFLF